MKIIVINFIMLVFYVFGLGGVGVLCKIIIIVNCI